MLLNNEEYPSVRDIAFIENRGQGIQKICDECKEIGGGTACL